MLPLNYNNSIGQRRNIRSELRRRSFVLRARYPQGYIYLESSSPPRLHSLSLSHALVARAFISIGNSILPGIQRSPPPVGRNGNRGQMVKSLRCAAMQDSRSFEKAKVQFFFMREIAVRKTRGALVFPGEKIEA